MSNRESKLNFKALGISLCCTVILLAVVGVLLPSKATVSSYATVSWNYYGDCDNNGKVDPADLALLGHAFEKNNINLIKSPAKCDIFKGTNKLTGKNSNGVIDSADFAALSGILASTSADACKLDNSKALTSFPACFKFNATTMGQFTATVLTVPTSSTTTTTSYMTTTTTASYMTTTTTTVRR